MDNQFEETSYTDEKREFSKTTENNIEAIRSDPSERAGEATGTSEATPFISSEMGALNLSTVSSPYESHLQTGAYQIIIIITICINPGLSNGFSQHTNNTDWAHCLQTL